MDEGFVGFGGVFFLFFFISNNVGGTPFIQILVFILEFAPSSKYLVLAVLIIRISVAIDQ